MGRPRAKGPDRAFDSSRHARAERGAGLAQLSKRARFAAPGAVGTRVRGQERRHLRRFAGEDGTAVARRGFGSARDRAGKPAAGGPRSAEGCVPALALFRAHVSAQRRRAIADGRTTFGRRPQHPVQRTALRPQGTRRWCTHSFGPERQDWRHAPALPARADEELAGQNNWFGRRLDRAGKRALSLPLELRAA